MPGPATGARVGQALANLLADTLTRHQAASLPGTNAAKFGLYSVIAERIERASAEELRPVLGDLLALPDLPEPAKQLARAALEPPAQDKVLVAIAAMAGSFFVVTGAAAQPFGAMFSAAAWRSQPVARLTPPTLATLTVRGAIDPGRAQAEARENGLNAERFDLLTKATGNPPGPQDLLTAYRRGVIDKGRLEQGIRQGDLRNEWIPTIEALRYAPVDPSTAIQAAVQGQASTAEAQRIAAQGGLDPAQFDLAYRVAGDPPGVVQMIELWQRGEVSRADVVQVIRESRVKTKYTDALLKLRRRLLPADTIGVLFGKGVLSHAEAAQRLSEYGYDPADVNAWLESHRQQQQQQTRDLAKGEILSLYGARSLTRAEADGLLRQLGYDQGEAGLLLDLTDTARLRRARDAALSRIHTLYVAHRIDRPEAAGAMGRLSVPADQQRELLGVWDLERAANVRDLTEAQIIAAYKRELFTEGEALTRLRAIGYQGQDAAILLTVATPAAAPTRALSTAQTLAALKRGVIDQTEADSRLADLGYDTAERRILLAP